MYSDDRIQMDGMYTSQNVLYQNLTLISNMNEL